jgi:hypothetical protein
VAVEQSVVEVDVALTDSAKLHDCPPKVSGNVALPVLVGVPLTTKARVPAPLARVPACKVAVRPVTPVELMAVPAAYVLALPPV